MDAEETFQQLDGITAAFDAITTSVNRHKVYKRSLTMPETASEMEKVSVPIEPTIQEESSSSDDDAEENVAPSGRIYYSPSSDSEGEDVVDGDDKEHIVKKELEKTDSNQNCTEPNKETKTIDPPKITIDDTTIKTQDNESDNQLNLTDQAKTTTSNSGTINAGIDAPAAQNLKNGTDTVNTQSELPQNGQPRKGSRQLNLKVFKQRFLHRQEAVDMERPPLSRSVSESEKTSLISNGSGKFLSFSTVRTFLEYPQYLHFNT